jgi:hypothetical protein
LALDRQCQLRMVLLISYLLQDMKALGI